MTYVCDFENFLFIYLFLHTENPLVLRTTEMPLKTFVEQQL